MELSRRRLLQAACLLAAPWVAVGSLPAWSAPPVLLSVRHHGARGDGRARDTAAIQATIDYGTFADRETTDFSFALLRGRGVQHVGIVGPGRIDGNRRWRGGPKPIALKV
jgi:hypothetical protein